MNKFYILFFSTFSLGVFAQDGVQERAKIADEMTMVASLDDVLSEKGHIIQLKDSLMLKEFVKHTVRIEQMRLELKSL